jgi:hypothetical protein
MKVVLILFGVGLIAAALIYVFYYNKPHRDIKREAADFELTAGELVREFIADEGAAHQKFNERVILLRGDVKQVIDRREGFSIVLIDGQEGLINCEFNESYDVLTEKIDEGETATIKGLYIGYNDLLHEIQLKQCTLEE